MNANWHPGCFRCEECNGELADAGFIKCQGRALCHSCNARVKAGALGKYICHQCQYVKSILNNSNYSSRKITFFFFKFIFLYLILLQWSC